MKDQVKDSGNTMKRRRRYGVWLSLFLGALLWASASSALWAQCSAPPNAVVAENCLAGNPSTEWDTGINGDDPSIVGFATDISVNVGQTINFKINTNAKAYTMNIYRMGYYGGMGARNVATITPSVTLPQTQPACLKDSTSNLVDCGNWAVSASWTVPTTATSGIYFVHLIRSDNQGDNHIFFIVRNDASHSDLLFQTSDESWQAYNDWGPGSGGSGGHSLYGPSGVFDITNRAFKVSYNRPFHTRDFENESLSFVFGAEYPMVRWLESNGYDVTYFTGMDADRNGNLILNHKVYLTVGHDEYWSGNQRANAETARAAGVNLAFFSGNEAFWKTRWENSIDGTGTPYRTLVCYKETLANSVIDPADPPTWTGTWRDPRFSPPADGGRPENALNGTIFMVNGPGTDNTGLSIQVPQADGQMRFWRNTSIASLPPGQTTTLPGGTLGYEWDEDLDNGSRPAGLFDLSTATYPLTTDLLLDNGGTYGAGTATHHMTLYRASGGALVFGAGTVQWSWGLDGNHDDPLNVGNPPDIRMQQATINLLADMGAQPGTIQPGLVFASASTDTIPPTSTISSPTPGTTLQGGTQVTVTGTAIDAGGGVVGGVEVSVDGGNTWHPATGRSNWTYLWTPGNSGPATVLSRATDDSGNIETPGAGISVTVQGRSCPCSIWSPSATPGTVDSGDGTAVEVGVKFTSDQNGFITGIRFYKSAANTGTHLGNLWTSTGNLLASAVFSGETASGWQQVSFSGPVAISANTTYVASYYAPAGHYSADGAYFAASGADNPPLHALANTVSSNGIYNYGPVSAFPTATFNGTNYWVDVIFNPTGGGSGPAVVSESPASTATGVSIGTLPTVTFSESMIASTINTNTFQLVVPSSGEGSTTVAAAVSYNSATLTATLTPTQPLAYLTTYTATVVGGASGVQDAVGEPLPANFVWSFTTAAAPPPPGSCPCTIWGPSSTPAAPDGGDPHGIELGVKFRADQGGYITGIRFYKSTANVGTHVGNLWTNTGVLLGTAIFSGESASGWQQVNFSSPIPITANATYVASYYAPVGRYSADSAFFSTSAVDTPPLHALANNVDGPDGVYTYGSTSAFPSSTFNSTNYWVDVVFDPNAGPGPSPTVITVSPLNGATGVATTTAVNATFSESMDLTTIGSGTFQLFDPSNTVVPASVSYNPSTLSATLTPTQALGNGATYTAMITGGAGGVKDGGGDAMAANYTWSFTTATGAPPPGQCPCFIWSASTTPVQVDGGDATAGEYGVKFYADQSGFITGIRFYKAVANTGTHIGHLWSSTGQLLASATFAGETASGWQQVNFSNAVFVTANTVYVASYYAPNGHYSFTGGYFVTGVDNAPLHSPADGVDGPNGVYNYGSTAFPTSTYQSSNYWVDAVFTTNPTNGTGPTVTSVSPANGSNAVATATSVAAMFSEAVDPATITTSSFQLLAPGGAQVAATVSYNSATMTATLNPVTQLAPLTSYTAVVVGGSTDPRVKDLAGNPLAATFTWSFGTGAAGGCPCTIWPSSTIPAQVDSGDPTPLEAGVKFTADQNGFIAGIRLYKTLANTGTHIGNLWTSTGTLLGTVTFSGETGTGWQQANFTNPVAITANTTYVASYYAPKGHYSADPAYFANAGVDNSPLHALQNGADGPNGVFAVGGSSAFPTSTFNSANYWVDVVFTTTANGSVSPTVISLSPAGGATGVSIGTTVTATFSEAIDSSTITSSTFQLLDPTNTTVPATISYNASTATATLTLSTELAPLTAYTAVLVGSTSGPAVKDLSENPLAANFSWTFTTGALPTNSGPGGPILVITNAANPFTSYLSEILQTEGLNEFAAIDIANVSSTTLAQYDIAVLGDMGLTPGQVSMLTGWVNSGGNLIAMHPDPQLASLLGLTDTQTSLSNAYLLANTTSGPGVGIVNQTIQFHGPAELYTLSGASSLATLYSDAATSTTSPAVSLNTVGTGQAAAFTYDLARSVVYTRQGNPAWSGQPRDGLSPIRSDDLFFGAAAGDPEPDWVDRSKIAIPQADEQQRFLANLILQMNSAKKPLPKFWYFPHGVPAVVIMTGDEHDGGGTAGRFNTYLADSPQGCSVADWQCVRSTSYIYAGNPLTNSQAASYAAQGFEIGLHVDPNPDCSNFNFSSLSSAFSSELSAWKAAYSSLPSPSTSRTHCVVWSDYDSQPQVELANGVRLDTTYYFYPPNWVNDQPGFFTGSGMPMRFTTINGATINVYQAATQLTDESGQTYPFEISTLLNNATGSLGYYGVFTANMHNDTVASAGSDAIIAAAQPLGVPIASALQMLQWLDGRNGSSFSALSWNANVLSFNISVGANTSGIEAMLPLNSSGGALQGLMLNGSTVSYTTQTIKGIQYAIFSAAPGAYQATYGSGATAQASPSSLTFTNQSVGTTSPGQSVTLSNTGTASLSLTSIALSGANSADFAQTNNCGTSLAGGANCKVTVTFTPTGTGTRTASLVITDNATGSPQTVGLTGTGVAPVASLSPASLAFGNGTIGLTSPGQTVTLSNTGGAALTITSVTITGANSGDFAQTNNCGTSLAAGANCTLTVTFTPTATGARGASLTVTDNAAGSPQTVGLSGTGVAAAPSVSLSPSSISFSDQLVGTSSAAQTVTLTNNGTASLSITSVTITGTNSGDFSQTNTCGTSVAVNASCTISVTFKPLATGTRSANLTFTDNAAGSPQTVALTGTGVAPVASLSPTSPSFSNQLVNTSSPAQAVTLTNSGTASLSITSIAITGTNKGDFSQTNTCGTSVTAGGSCTISVTFKPLATGTRSANLTLTDNAAGSPQTVALTGTGVAPVASLSPASLFFSGQLVNTSSPAQTVTLTNTGTASLSITSIAITGTNKGDFSQTNTCGTSVAVNASCTINVTFTPVAAGSRTANLSVTDNAAGSPQKATLTGTGLAPTVSLSPTSLTFATQLVGSSSAGQTVTLSNTGTGSLNIISITITGTNSGDFSQTNTCGTTVAPGGNCTISVTFKPTHSGSRTGKVSISDNASGSPQTASLSGTGTVVSLSPASLSFASQPVGTSGSPQTATLTNTGTSSLSITSISITGTNAGDFSQTNTCGSSVKAGKSCSVTVTFKPEATGARAASVSVSDSGGGSPQLLSLSGTGT